MSISSVLAGVAAVLAALSIAFQPQIMMALAICFLSLSICIGGVKQPA